MEIQKLSTRSRGWSASAIFICTILLYSPKLRYDSLVYIETARSIVYDGDLNAYNEKYFFTEPGWNDVTKRAAFNAKIRLISFMPTPDYTENGYRFVFFPLGNTIFWLPPMATTHVLCKAFKALEKRFPDTGYSSLTILSLSLWNLVWFLLGVKLAIRILMNFFSESVSTTSVIIITAAGNSLPFALIDICFSHALDFFLVNAMIIVWLKIIKQSDWTFYFLWGALLGFSMIVRYQDVFFVILPVFDFATRVGRMIQRQEYFRFILRHFLAFIVGFFSIISLQMIYWKIIFGSYLIHSRTMGTSDIPSFSALNPQIVPMFFSKFHGLFAWMPLLALTCVAFFIFAWKRPSIGIGLASVFLIQSFYNSTRTEWWNLGFGVRRYAGFGIFFMLGLAMILNAIKNSRFKFIFILICVVFCIWNILFMMHYYLPVTSQADQLNNRIYQDIGPYKTPEYGWVGPCFSKLPMMIQSCYDWMKGEAKILSYISISFQSGCKNQISLAVAFPLLFGMLIFIMFFMDVSVLNSKNRRMLMSIMIMFLSLTAFRSLRMLDRSMMDILALRSDPKTKKMTIQSVRIRKDAVFWGEYKYLNATASVTWLGTLEKVFGKTLYLILRLPVDFDAADLPDAFTRYPYGISSCEALLTCEKAADFEAAKWIGNAAFEKAIAVYKIKPSLSEESCDINLINDPLCRMEIIAAWWN